MRNTIFKLLLALLGWSTSFAQVGIGTPTPDASTILDVNADDLLPNEKKGFLPPRMSDNDRNSIDSPAAGLVIYNTNENCLQLFDGSFWYDACKGKRVIIPNNNLTVASPTYQGASVINGQGIGYNGEVVPAASTITVQLTNNSAAVQNYGLIATDAGTGLQYTATGVIAGNTTIPVILNHNEPSIAWTFYGTITMLLQGASNTINLEPRIDILSISGNGWVVGVDFNEVTIGSQIWMDRNLGARRVATVADDPLSYGNYYQWGRLADGHEIVVIKGDDITLGKGLEPTTTTLATSDIPVTNEFILINGDWRVAPATPRWSTSTQGPCPDGFRVPTEAEFNTMLADASITNSATAFSSSLYFPINGFRDLWTGDISAIWEGLEENDYWTRDIAGNGRPFFIGIRSADFYVASADEAWGLGLRCIKN